VKTHDFWKGIDSWLVDKLRLQKPWFNMQGMTRPCQVPSGDSAPATASCEHLPTTWDAPRGRVSCQIKRG
jgi:hypothetical protein